MTERHSSSARHAVKVAFTSRRDPACSSQSTGPLQKREAPFFFGSGKCNARKQIKNRGLGPARLDEKSLNGWSLVSVEVARCQRARSGLRQTGAAAFRGSGLKLVGLRLMRRWKLEAGKMRDPVAVWTRDTLMILGTLMRFIT